MNANDELLKWYMHYEGLKEVPGPKSNPTILGWARELLPWVKDDSDVDWCAVARARAAKDTKTAKPKNAYGARMWLRAGLEIDLEDALPGDTLVYSRGPLGSWQGHVGLLVEKGVGQLLTLGGNQKNRIGRDWMPITRLLGIRRFELP